MLSALVRRRLLCLTPRSSHLLLSARPTMMLQRTKSNSKDEPQRSASSGKEAASSSGREVEMTSIQQNAHKVSERNSSLEKSMRTELGKAGALEVSQQLPASKGGPTVPLLG